ncbi:MAG: ABC transporter substrate-binding protein [Luteitalea sp.]|nr:ABC transporter substrate-binding protein [Luteitalea sp.]
MVGTVSVKTSTVAGRWRALAVALAVCGVFAAVPAAERVPDGNMIRGCVDRYDAATDYFPDKVTVEDAVKFSVTYHRSYKVISVRETVTGKPSEKYVLVQCGASVPKLERELAGAQVVTVPISSLYSASTTHLQLLVDLQRLDVLTGVSTMKQLIGDEILKRANSGRVREFAPISVVDAELVVSQRPGLFMTGGTTSAPLAVVRSAGIPVVTNNEWLEPTGLARAEWLKYMALFLNEERAAQGIYNAMKARYKVLSATAMSVPDDKKPIVMTGRGTRGDFVIAGGRSYVAALIKDAGGRYAWADNLVTGSETIDLEAQIRRAGNADIWINGGGWQSLASMVKDEPRYSEFKAYRTRQVWVYERRVTSTGGNDYWSRAVSHPDLVLADLVKVFHPALVPKHEFQWYIQVPAR